MKDANQQVVGTSAAAHAVMLTGAGGDRTASLVWTEEVPWIVDSTEVFRKIDTVFVKIAATNAMEYVDTRVQNDVAYQYYVRTFGHYTLEGLPCPLVNYSAVVEVKPSEIEPEPEPDEPVYELPNVFTPNGDGYNDVFEPKVTGADLIVSAKTVIFNRWGNILWDTDDPLIQWDGKSKTTKMDCPPGTYFYVCEITYLGETGEEQLRLQGSITIVR